MALTFEQAKNLRPGDVLHSTVHNNADGTPQRWKVNGAVKTWKRDPSRIYIPLKFGLKGYDSLTEADFHNGVCHVLELPS